jgi:transcriptional regulator with XRE-family HTH domain
MKKFQFIGANIRMFRTEQKMTQAALATQAGISRIALIHIEHSKALPSLDTVMSLAEVLKIPVTKVLTVPEDSADEQMKKLGLAPTEIERCELEIQAIHSILKRCTLSQLESIRKTVISHPVFQVAVDEVVPTLKAN